MEELRADVGGREVTVMALRIDGKKMTLALFRQIPQADCLTSEHVFDATLKPWGRVAYKIPKEGNEWLLAEREGQLLRCSLDLPSLSPWAVEHHSKGITESEEKLQGTESLGKHGTGLAAIYRSSLERHQQELPKAKAQLAADKARHAALLQLKTLPQLFIA